jgi:hypothetical protein
MLDNRKVIVDSFCEVKEFTGGFEDERFYNFDTHEIVPGAIYIISRQTFHKNIELIRQLAENRTILPVLGNPAEGSETILSQLMTLGITDLVRQQRIAVIAGGEMQSDIPCFCFENFLPKILDYNENLQAIEDYKQQWSEIRPYKFLFLNGRGRAHRRQLLSRLENLLSQAIYSNLDATHGQSIRLLPAKYEVDFYKDNTALSHTGYIKYDLFKQEWGEIYLNSAAYNDTYFSLVTETVFDYPHSFRTEKIWKPMAMGHPWIAVANVGYYRDITSIGFKSFGGLIDESFDQIENNQQRLERIAQEVEWLCQQDLAKFAQESYNICKYNQQLLSQLQLQTRRELPERISNFLKSYNERS